MSSYCTQADILGEIQLTDLIALTDDQSTGNLDTTILNQIITNASNFIDGQVANIYTVPFNPVPSVINMMAITIVCYRLYRRRLVPDEKNNFFEDYESVRKKLLEVGKGESHLDLTIQRDFSQVTATGRPSVFGTGNCLSNTM